MCLIIAKPRGVAMPSNKEMRLAFHENPDGFGMSFQHEGQVRTVKGAMTEQTMYTLIAKAKRMICPAKIKDIDVVLQWRKAMTGRVCQEFCHPFPISSSQEDLDALDVMSVYSLAHNGVIWEYNQRARGSKHGDINDAQEFIKDYLVGMGDAVTNPGVGQLIEEHTYSKFAILSPDGIALIGNFEKEQGLWYSNFWHRPTTVHNAPYSDKYLPVVYDDETKFLPPVKEGYKIISSPQTCELCGNLTYRLYWLPNDWQSEVCFSCYYQMEGAYPSDIELAWTAYDEAY